MRRQRHALTLDLSMPESASELLQLGLVQPASCHVYDAARVLSHFATLTFAISCVQKTLLRACTGDDGGEPSVLDSAGWAQRLQHEEAVMLTAAGVLSRKVI